MCVCGHTYLRSYKEKEVATSFSPRCLRDFSAPICPSKCLGVVEDKVDVFEQGALVSDKRVA